MSDYTNEELLSVFLMATRLASLHRKEGGLKLSLKHYEKMSDDYRQEIIQRMEKRGPLPRQ